MSDQSLIVSYKAQVKSYRLYQMPYSKKVYLNPHTPDRFTLSRARFEIDHFFRTYLLKRNLQRS